ncbi:MAG: SCP2 sterol-binding domain-containing protein [Acidobacteriota bacterium]
MSDAPPYDVFSDAWIAAWADEIRNSDPYRQAAQRWEGSVALRAADVPDLAAFLDLHHGACRDARRAQGDDVEQADFVLAADLGVWQRVLERQLEPILGLMSGQLKLERGSMTRLLPYTKASQELVAAATRVPTRFP